MVSAFAVPVAVAKAFSPGHITGFFQKPVGHRNYLHYGSKGAGFSIDKGISTFVHVHESDKPGYRISINGETVENAEVSRYIAERFLNLANSSYFLEIVHESQIPIGFGLGSSGAAALSLSYALNKALETGLNKEQAAQIAHQAEIYCRTGLGTVIAEYSGGFEIRTEIGAPGYGSVDKIEINGYKAIILCIAPISTKDFLTRRTDLLYNMGERMLDRMRKTRDINDFLKMSGEFASLIGLTDDKCKAPIQSLISNGFGFGVALFGQTVFTVVPKERARLAYDCLKSFDGTLLECNIDNLGARVL